MSSSSTRFSSAALVASAKSRLSATTSFRRADVPESTKRQDDAEAGCAVHDESLIARVCEGDNDALSLLFHRYARVVRGVALRVLQDAAEADDLLQDVFVLVHRLCRTFDSSKGSARSWILHIAYRRAISRRRYLNSRNFYTSVDLGDEQVQGREAREQTNDPVTQVLAELDLQKMFGTLSEDQQKTLRLHFIEGYTLDEIAKMLGQTKGNIRHHSFRGLEKLRKLIFGGELSGPRAV